MEGDLDIVVRQLERIPLFVLLIDGGSGAGTSVLADRLAPRFGAQIVRLDDLYPGWDGLEHGSEAVADEVIAQRRWRRWDWPSLALAEWHDLDPTRPLVIEGSGSLSATNRAVADFGIWIELDAVTRKRRALARDGEAYAPYWDRWAAQERTFFERERPDLVADFILRP